MIPEMTHRILVVDDNRAIQEDFRKILSTDHHAETFDREEAKFFGNVPRPAPGISFDLDFASQGAEALEKVIAAQASGARFSVVFMDVRMPPGWDGIETTAKLWEADPDLQVVLCTAFSDYSWEEIVKSLGHSDRLLILKKPFDVMEVVQCAHALSGKWSLLQKTREHAASLEETVRLRTADLEREIAERRRSEEALRFTQFSVDNASDAMFWVTSNGSLRYGNAATCRTLGYTAEELQQMRMSDILPELPEREWDEFWNSFDLAPSRVFEATHVAKDGHRVPIELTATLFTYGGEQLLCVSARDITVRKQILADLSAARDAALESVRLKSQFLANMSHEIRTPMNGVIGMAELLLHTNLDRDQRQFTDTIRGSADLLLHIINDILDSSKIESGTVDFENNDFNLNSVIEGTLDLISGTAQAKGLELVGYIPADVFPDLRGDAGRLRQVLTNIVGNAVKFTAKGEVVLSVATISQTDDHARLRFAIRDTGIGIPAEACQRIFEPFMQADGSDTRKYGGTGLGLTICRQLVEALGGEIGVESEPGAGTTFWFELDFDKQTANSAAAAAWNFPQDLRVLAVDDNPTNRQILGQQLKNLKLRPLLAVDGYEALETLFRENAVGNPIRIALIDMQMPGMNGMTLARRIKSDPSLASTRLILLSSNDHQISDAELRSAGIEGYLVKPLKQTRLGDALHTLYTQRRPIAPPAKPANPSVAPDHPLRILLAEDNAVNRQVALLQLKSLGHTADTANDGAEAVSAVEKSAYDVILMDCQMPNMDGYEATRRIREKHSRTIRIIAMTASAMQGDHEKCLAAGMDAYLSKPVDSRELGRLLTQCKNDLTVSRPNAALVANGAETPVDFSRLNEITGNNPDMLRQISHDYLEQAEEILTRLVVAIERGSARDVHQLAHKLCGSSASCGMRAIVPPLARLEQLGKSSHLAEATSYQLDAAHQLARIRRSLTRHLDHLTTPVA
jgi:two-component system sensor histidine kinase/response regulator